MAASLALAAALAMMAAFSLLTAELGAGVFSQEAVAVERVTTELGDVERLSTELAHGAEEDAQVAAEVTH